MFKKSKILFAILFMVPILALSGCSLSNDSIVDLQNQIKSLTNEVASITT